MAKNLYKWYAEKLDKKDSDNNELIAEGTEYGVDASTVEALVITDLITAAKVTRDDIASRKVAVHVSPF